MGWISRQFSTRTIVLMPIAIAINIVLGVAVQQVLKLPIYLDSIGTILVGVLAGPLAGALTGILSNIIWQYAPGIGGGTIGPFAITAGVIGLMAGIWGQLGIYRTRPASRLVLILAAVTAAVIIAVVVLPILNNPAYSDPANGYPSWVFTAIEVIAIVAAIMVGGFILLSRDLAGFWVALAGVLTGIVAAFVSAPIAAYVFGGVTGSGVDVIVAALRQGGSDVIHASLGQGLFSDPIDKTITSFVVFIILARMSRRIIARFPNGEHLVGPNVE
ncbi:MAG TPA: hypothetical protein VKR24_05755 [Candidatus Limnocylindrales bacterium]|nr:hypothetical protein [Candidatus Limnocylindrales bacterium]